MDRTMTEDRTERVSAALETQFHICRKETDAYLSAVRTSDGVISPGCIGDFLKFVRVNAQLAGVIARLDAVKNRNSKTK
jgi:acetate kinase